MHCLGIVASDPEGGIILEDDVVVRDDLATQTRSLRCRALSETGDDDFAVLLYSSRDPRRIGQPGSANVIRPNLFFGTQGMY